MFRSDIVSSGDGTAWEDAFSTLSEATSAATEDGDEIWVQKGTYEPAAKIYFPYGITISMYGGFLGTETNLSDRDSAINETRIDGSGVQYNGQIMAMYNGRLDGFTLTNGTARGALTISGEGSPVISHCKFLNNTSTDTGNSEGYDGGGAIRIHTSTPQIVNCIFAGNTADYGGAVNIQSGIATFINCTFTRNTAIKGTSVYNYGNDPQNLYNNIFWGNTGSGDIATRWGVSWVQTNNIFPGYGDPLLIDPDNGNYHIAPGSSCIDAGTMSPSLPTEDMDGDNRVLDGDANGSNVVDIGADEYDPNKDYYADIYVDGTDGDDANDGSSWATAKQTLQAAVVAALAGDEIWMRAGTYLLAAEVTIDKQLFVYGGFIGTEIQRISRNWQQNPTILDGQNAVRCLQLTSDADNSRVDGISIINGNSSSGGGVLVRASYALLVNCIIDSNTSTANGGGIYFSGRSTIQNCQVSNNTATSWGGGVYNSYISSTIDSCLIDDNQAGSGGGIFNDGGYAPIITNSIIRNNYASDRGAGICNDEKNDAEISNCEIIGNTASGWGGGVYSGQPSGSNTNSAKVKLTNTIIANNFASYGGGLYCATRSSVEIMNCTIAGNTAHTNGAGLYVYHAYSYVTSMNSIFFGNVLEAGGYANIYFITYGGVEGSSETNLSLFNNDFSVLDDSWHNAGDNRTNNIGVFVNFADYEGPDGDPLTGGDSDYHIPDNSGVVDQGIDSKMWYQLYTAPATDIEGTPRPQGSGYDIGAYEAIISTYTLTMASSPIAGGTTVPAAGPTQVLPATLQDISASPATGYNFTGWSTSGSEAVVTNPLAATTAVTLTGHAEVTAQFCLIQTWYEDSDDDGYGDPLSTPLNNCTQPIGYVTDQTDCDDTDANEHPYQTWYMDEDSDGYSDGTTNTASCERPSNYYIHSELTAVSGDCNDLDGSIHPEAIEIADDSIDQDCNGSDTVSCFVDNDHDGYGTDSGTLILAQDGICNTNEGESVSSDDCNDNNDNIHPGATEIIDDNIDQDCNGSDSITCYTDADLDGYGTGVATPIFADDGTCDTADGESTTYDDCNDSNINEYPGQVWYQDSDGDGYGSSLVSITQCSQPTGYILDNSDCNDISSDEHPEQIWYQDTDADNLGNPLIYLTQCSQPAGYVTDNTDCNDSNSATDACKDDDNDNISTNIDGYMDTTTNSFISESNLFSSRFTDTPEGGVTSGTISSRADLTLSIGDAETGGISISATGGTDTARISLCGFNLAISNGDYCVATCGSLTLEIVSGPMEVYLSTTDYVIIPEMVTAKITETSKGTFTIEHQVGTESIIFYAGSKETLIASGEEKVVQLGFPWTMFMPAIINQAPTSH